MCGIAGVIGRGEVSVPLGRMLAAMRHRGPDDSGVTCLATPSGQVALGNTRLAILDLSPAGHMPMHDPATGNCMTYNGEIYNFQQLRDELEGAGERFRSQTDTEVVLAAYRRWGADCLQQLRGMFALAVWDERKRELFLARDRPGKKPLYYARLPDGTFLFASEVRALLASRLVAAILDPDALEVYLHNGFLVAPVTMVRDVRSLLPGHWMRVGENGEILQMTRYWSPASASGSGADKPSTASEMLQSRLEEAVRLRLISDVPLGAFLSGGLDSAAIVALMARAGGELRTFSVTFDEAEEGPQGGIWHWSLVGFGIAAIDMPIASGPEESPSRRRTRHASLEMASRRGATPKGG